MSKYDLNLNLIKEMIERIESDLNKPLEDKTVWDAMLMRFQVIGESIQRLPEEIREKYGEVNWKKFYSLRNLISHTYSGVYTEVLSKLIDQLPELKKTIKKIRSELK